jgi:flagellar motility protein MotE (MotC chaperone)
MKNSSRQALAFCTVLIANIFFSHNCLSEETAAAVKDGAPAFSSVEERRILTKIQDNQASTTETDKGLSMKEKELKTLNDAADKKLEEINRKLEELQEVQKTLKAMTAQKDAAELKRIKELGKIYEKMTPEKAALALNNMDNKLAADLLANMKVKSAAKILNVLDRKKASELSITFSTVK